MNELNLRPSDISDLHAHLRRCRREAAAYAATAAPRSELKADLLLRHGDFRRLSRQLTEGRLSADSVRFLEHCVHLPIEVMSAPARRALTERARQVVAAVRDKSCSVLQVRRRDPEVRAVRVARATSAQYQYHFDRTIGAGLYPVNVARTRKSLRTMTSGCRVILARRLASNAHWLESGEIHDDEIAADVIRGLHADLMHFRRIGLDLARAEADAMARRPSKKRGLQDFGHGAADRVFAAASHDRRLRDAIAAVIVFGARPAEAELGLRVRALSNARGDFLAACIRGAKLTEVSGQPRRQIVVQAVDSAARHLFEAAKQLRGSLVIQAKAKAVSDAIARAGRNAFPKSKHKLAAYNFRHEFSAELKRHQDPETVAQALGHTSARSQGFYGSWSRSRGGPRNPIVRVRASRRVVKVDHMLKRKMKSGTQSAAPRLVRR